MLPSEIQGVLIDIAGVLYSGDEPISGSREAIRRMVDSDIPLRFLTNTTRSPREHLLKKLRGMGFEIEPNSLFTAPGATRSYIKHHKLRPYLLIHPNLAPEFADINCHAPNAVVVGDAGDAFSYRSLNKAFRVLMKGGLLIAMGSNRYFREEAGLSLDMGPFVEALRFASGVEPTVIGKPSADFFRQALDDIHIAADRSVMIGDDLESDIGGAQAQGIRGILVRTGKYRPTDESQASITPDLVVDNLADAVDRILDSPRHSL